MTQEMTSPWRAQFVLAADVARAHSATAFYRSVRAGAFVTIARGVFLPTHAWKALSVDEQYLARVHAVAATSTAQHVHAFESAAALWRLPIIGAWPAKVHILADDGVSRSRAQWTAHARDGVAETRQVEGLEVTTLARTVVDIARTRPLSVSVAMADAALSATRRDRATELDLRLEIGRASSYGLARARHAVDFADGRSESAGESLSRVGIHVLGLPAPQLQHEFRDAEGSMFVDFWWPEFNLVGEFDGFGKYLRSELLNGQSTADALMKEKRRENRLRALGPSVVRWEWADALNLRLLEAKLRAGGLR
jgi:hypothetical protein